MGGQRIERSFAHMYEPGGMRRTHRRGHDNIRKRILVHAGAFNLALLMRSTFGRGTPRGLQGLISLLSPLTIAIRDACEAMAALWSTPASPSACRYHLTAPRQVP